MRKIIAQGAEALLIRKNNFLIKRRIGKGYRQSQLDIKLRLGRTRREARMLKRASGLISVPSVLDVNEEQAEIIMDFVNGKLLADYLDSISLKEATKICNQLGREVAKLHSAEIIHGDLTTSNMLLWKNKIFFVDFGLGFFSSRVEDKAVDLHLLREAFESKHFARWQHYLKAALQGYRAESKEAVQVLQQLEKVEARGRYKRKAKRTKKRKKSK